MAVFRDNSLCVCDIIHISEQDADGQTICADREHQTHPIPRFFICLNN